MWIIIENQASEFRNIIIINDTYYIKRYNNTLITWLVI